MAKSEIKSTRCMTNTQYHQEGAPDWWARIGTGAQARFLEIPDVRGDRILWVDIDAEPGTEVVIGCGKGPRKIRETVISKPVKEETK